MDLEVISNSEKVRHQMIYYAINALVLVYRGFFDFLSFFADLFIYGLQSGFFMI